LEGSTVNGSFSNTTVTVTENFDSHNDSYTGGFIGYLNVVSASAEIKSCYATGNVTVSSQAGSLYAGGLLGRAAGGGTRGGTVTKSLRLFVIEHERRLLFFRGFGAEAQGEGKEVIQIGI
jgi:hypothetical protein